MLFIPSVTFLQKHIEENDGNNSNYHIEYDQAPRTPGLLEESNLSNIQETSACDDHLESENQNLTGYAAKENSENASSNPDLYLSHKNVMNDFLHSRMDSDLPSIFPPALGDQVGAIAVENDSSVSTCPAPSIPDGGKDVQNGIFSHISFPDKTCENCHEFQEQEVRPDEHNVGTRNVSNTCEPVSEGMLESSGTSYKAELPNNVESAGEIMQSCLHVNALKSNAEFNSPSEHEKSETENKTDISKRDILDSGISVHEHVARTEEANQIESSVAPNILIEVAGSCLEAFEREENLLSVKSLAGIQG